MTLETGPENYQEILKKELAQKQRRPIATCPLAIE
jgi:hypothetical protein